MTNINHYFNEYTIFKVTFEENNIRFNRSIVAKPEQALSEFEQQLRVELREEKIKIINISEEEPAFKLREN